MLAFWGPNHDLWCKPSLTHADIDRIGAAREHVPHALRYDPATPRAYEKPKSYGCGPLVTGIQFLRIATTQVPKTNKSRRDPMSGDDQSKKK